jgi:phage-related tail fiber protein
MSYLATITNIGLAKIADAIANNTPLNLSTMKIGDGNGNTTTPSETDTDLVRSVYSGAANRIDTDPTDETRIVCELIVPAAEGGFTIREIGVFDDEGDLIAIAQFPPVYKPLPSEGATLDLVARLFLVVANTDAITLIIDTAVVVATRQWVNDQLDLLIPGGTTDQILAKVSNASGDYEWRDPTAVNVTVNIVEEEQTLVTGQTIVDLATCTTEGLAVYIEGIRLHPPDWAATTATRVTLAVSYASGSKIYLAQNEPTGGSNFLAQNQNLADVPDKSIARTNLELLTNSTYLTALWQIMQQRTYPVGEIFMTRQNGNPSSLLGFGSWERYAQGRVLAGFDEADSSFNALDKIGGAKTHVLTEAEIPAHTHSNIVALSTANDFDTTGGNSGGVRRLASQTGSTGGGQAHNNLQPYITVFFWKRTA